MLKLFSIILLFFISQNNFAQYKYDWNLKGFLLEIDDIEFKKIKKTNIKYKYVYASYTPITNFDDSLVTLAKIIHFNKAGDADTIIEASKSGLIEEMLFNTYDTKGNLIVTEIRDDYNNIKAKKITKYNEKNMVVEREETVTRPRKYEKVKFVNDDSGKVKETSTYGKGDVYLGKELYKYSADGLISLKIFDSNDEEILELRFSYSNGVRTKQYVLDKAKKILGQTKYRYDTNGYLIEFSTENFSRVFSYDDIGNILTDELYGENQIRQYKLIFTYNEDGLLETAVRLDIRDNPVFYAAYEYEYYTE